MIGHTSATMDDRESLGHFIDRYMERERLADHFDPEEPHEEYYDDEEKQ